MKLSKMANLIPLAQELCREFDKGQRTVRHKGEISLYDTFQCSAKYYAMRMMSPSLSCESSANLTKAHAIKEKILPIYEGDGFERHKEFLGQIKGYLAYSGMSALDTFTATIIASPDLSKLNGTSIGDIIDVRYHQVEKGALTAIMAAQHAFLRELRPFGVPEVPHLANYKDEIERSKYGSYYPAYINDLIQILVEDQFASWDSCQPLSKWGKEDIDPKGDLDMCAVNSRTLHLKQILKDGPFDIEIKREDIRNLWPWFWENLKNTLFGWRISENNPNDFNVEVFNTLVLHEIIDNTSSKYYQCQSCPFHNHVCAGMPPLRALNKKHSDVENMIKFNQYWEDVLRSANLNSNMPKPPLYQLNSPYTDSNGRKYKSKTKADWKETVKWTKRVHILLSRLDRALPLQLEKLNLLGPRQ